ncbi:UDP-glucose 4-epimerase GalE [Stenotrophomonas lactitubi]|uniref:UDP-glucose 4-epimerase GalE n=1 Tax=Stenotrophomonas lactitubi TaxID=2045214 RepID=UPI0031B9E076
MLNILVCGGAGYIGSHMCQWLEAHGHSVAVLDNLSTGHREAVRWGEFICADLQDRSSIDQVFAARSYDVVMHFAASSLVGVSMKDPVATYQNNIAGTLNLLEAMRRHGVGKLVFSSTAAVYGEPRVDLVDELHPLEPINPYGSSKRMVECILEDAAMAYGLRTIALRYFNAAGALWEQGIGEAHACETHLIPNVLRAAAGSGSKLSVFGNNYSTPDGTCIRDYVHVGDLANAHGLAIEYMQSHEGFHAFNLGSENGYSVMEVIAAAADVVGRVVPFEITARRAGDPAKLVASSAKAQRLLGWKRDWTDLRSIVQSAWQWHRQQPY